MLPGTFLAVCACSGTGEAPLEATATARAGNRDSCALRLAERAAPFAEEPECRIECRGRVLKRDWASSSAHPHILLPGVLDGSARLAKSFASCGREAEILGHPPNVSVNSDRDDLERAQCRHAWIGKDTYPDGCDLRPPQQREERCPVAPDALHGFEQFGGVSCSGLDNGVDFRRGALGDLADRLAKSGIGKSTLRGASALPGIEARTGNAEHAAEQRDRELRLLRRDEAEAPDRVPLSLAKKAAAFSGSPVLARVSGRAGRSSRSSWRSPVARPSRSPVSTAAWPSHLRNDSSQTPSSRAISVTGRPSRWTSSTASRPNPSRQGSRQSDPPARANTPPARQDNTRQTPRHPQNGGTPLGSEPPPQTSGSMPPKIFSPEPSSKAVHPAANRSRPRQAPPSRGSRH